MIVALSPAKSLDASAPRPSLPATQPALLAEAAALMTTCRRLSKKKIAALMDLSDKLAELNHERFAAWTEDHTPANAKQAALLFDGDTYKGLDAPSLGDADLAFAQDHVAILSGLYGVLRPLDLVQPYRLEMGSRLPTRRGKDLYAFWGDRVTKHLAARLREHDEPLLVNAASDEYASVLTPRALPGFLDVDFRERRADGRLQVISFFAKRARGALARFVVEERVDRRAGLRDFARDGYVLDAGLCTPDRLVFVRPHPNEA